MPEARRRSANERLPGRRTAGNRSETPGGRREAEVARWYDFPQKMRVTLASVVLLGAALAVLVLGAQVFLVAFAGVLFAIFVLSIASLVSRYTPLSQRWAVTLTALVLVGAFAASSILMWPVVTEQAGQFQDQLPQLTDRLSKHWWGAWILNQLGEGELSGAFGAAARLIFENLTLTLTFLLSIVFIGLFGAYDPQRYTAGIVSLFPPRHRTRAAEVLHEIGDSLRWWLIGRAVGMTLVGVSIILLLTVLGLPFGVLLGLIAGLFEFVPYFGPIAAGVPILLFALLESAQTFLYVMAGYLVIQTLESYLLEPIIMQRTVALPPVFTLVMQLLMGTLFGVIGIAMATPLAAVLHVLVRTVYRQDILGEGSGAAREADHGPAASA